MARDTSSPALALRAALLSPWEPLRYAARHVLYTASLGRTNQQASDELDISRSAYQRLSADFPWAFEAPECSPEKK